MKNGVSCKILIQTAFHARPKTEEHMLDVMDKPMHEEKLAQSLPNNIKQFGIVVTFHLL